jgi:hypothetical protein
MACKVSFTHSSLTLVLEVIPEHKVGPEADFPSLRANPKEPARLPRRMRIRDYHGKDAAYKGKK